MSEEKEKIKITGGRNLKTFVGTFLILLLCGLIFLLTAKKEELKVEKKEPLTFETVSCKKSTPSDSDIFRLKNAISSESSFLFAFRDSVLNDVMFTYRAELESSSAAESGSAELLVTYDRFMGATGGTRSLYNPTNSAIDKTAKIILYAKRSGITDETKGIFLLPKNVDVKKVTTNELKSVYEKLNYVCELKQ